MNSSISNSKARPSRSPSLRRVALVLLLLFGILEGFTRFQLVQMSRDLQRFTTYPQRAATLHTAPKTRLAILGNSAAERALDPQALQKLLAVRQIPTTIDIFTADASHLNTWEPMAQSLFWSPNQAPDVLVVPFFGTSLADDNDLEIGRIAQFFTLPADRLHYLKQLPDTATRLDFAVSSVWATYATRTRLKERVLTLITPAYRTFTADLQAINQPASRATGALTYRGLERFLVRARAQNCPVVFVAMPLRDAPYEIAPDLRARLQKSGVDLLDLRRIAILKPAFYADSIHLNPQGRAVLTPLLARKLTPLLTR